MYYAETAVTPHVPDLHVASLRYTLKLDERCSFNNPPAVTFETEDANFRLDSGKLLCEMKTHFSKVEEARAVVEPVLRAWEVDADLRLGRGQFRFQFEGPDVIDRSPTPPGTVNLVMYASAGGTLFSAGEVSLHVTRVRYPEPPPNTFRLTSEAQDVLDRYYRYLDGREYLIHTVFYILTLIEGMVPDKGNGSRRQRAAIECNIEWEVLDMMGKLTSEQYGDRLTARKFSPSQQPLTPTQSTWLDAVAKQLIWRLGTRNSQRKKLTMSDLPPLLGPG